MEQLIRLPLFPLNIVLFPGQMVPLHIFEPRYRLMIEQCEKDKSPFGVVLIRQDTPADAPTVPHTVGTTARLMNVDRLPDGRMNIVVAGETRFRILELYDDQPYLTGDVVIWPWTADNLVRLLTPIHEVRQGLERYLALLARSLGDLVEVGNIPVHPLTLACLAAIALQISPNEKQNLLAEPTIGALLEKEIALLERETRALRITDGVPTRLVERGERLLSDN